MSIINVPLNLREKLGNKAVEELVGLLNEVEEKSRDRSMEIVESKFEKRLVEESFSIKSELKEEIAQVRSELKEEIAQVRSELKEEIAQVRSELKEEIAQVRDELKEVKLSLIKWMIGFFIGQSALLLSVLAIFLK